MPHKAQTDSENEKQTKPKEQFRIVLSIYDNGVVDRDLIEWYLNDETGKRKRLMYDSSSKFKKSIQDNLGENVNQLACWVLESLNIDSNRFARDITSQTTIDEIESEVETDD